LLIFSKVRAAEYFVRNYKSLVDLFEGRECGQSPQILSVYAI